MSSEMLPESKGAWISPEGKVYDLGAFGKRGSLSHYEFMLKYPKLFGLTKDMIASLKKTETMSPENAFRLWAVKRGWIRQRFARHYYEMSPIFELWELGQTQIGDILIFLMKQDLSASATVQVNELKTGTELEMPYKDILAGALEQYARNKPKNTLSADSQKPTK